MSKRLTTEEFIEKARLVHGDKYDYSLVNYINTETDISITCKIHGNFEQTPHVHLNNSGCVKCSYISIGNIKRKSVSDFIHDAKLIHGNKYDYSSVIYINNNTKIKIICPIHGIFEQTPINHLGGHICVYCSGLNRKTTETFIKEAILIHGDKYDYSNVVYHKSIDNVIINCVKHGPFNQTPITHLSGSNCPNCDYEQRRKTTEEFISEANLVHGNMYNYANVTYLSSRDKVSIICLVHGVFKQNPNSHLNGNGCPVCKNSKGEIAVRNYLLKNKISFISQHKFSDCKNIHLLRFDFYLPDYNICIEYNGRQHYEPVNIFGGINGFKLTINRDRLKSNYCYKNNIELIIIKHTENVDSILNKLLNRITIVT